ncbi:MAG: hypothetical protein M3N45_06410 [Actinomycetota bacterium]|nr:hypothetical protein [Actinomycetota bacterium]
MRRTYTTGLVLLTAALLILACFLFALAQGGQAPGPQRSARRPNRHLVQVGRVGGRRGVGPGRAAG